MNYLDFIRDFRAFQSLADGRFTVSWRDRYPILGERTAETKFDRHYIYHPAWAARILAKTKPKLHTDISSTLHFCSLVSAFLPVQFYDFRPVPLKLNGLSVGRADLTSLPFADDSILSLSCMHVVEHIGLGRYGGNIDPGGDLKAIGELKRVLRPGGSLLFVVPVGKPKICFNAHRIYGLKQVLTYFSDLSLQELAVVPDKGEGEGLMINPSRGFCDRQKYACGCFWFRKDE